MRGSGAWKLRRDVSPMTGHRVALPPRTDLRSRRERVAASSDGPRSGSLRAAEVAGARQRHTSGRGSLLPCLQNLEAFRPGEVLDSRPVEVRSVPPRDQGRCLAGEVPLHRHSWSLRCPAVTTVMVPQRPVQRVGQAAALLPVRHRQPGRGRRSVLHTAARRPVGASFRRPGPAPRVGGRHHRLHRTAARVRRRCAGGPLRARRHPRRSRVRTGWLRRRHADRPLGLLGRSASNPLRGRTAPELRAGAEHRGRRRRRHHGRPHHDDRDVRGRVRRQRPQRDPARRASSGSAASSRTSTCSAPSHRRVRPWWRRRPR